MVTGHDLNEIVRTCALPYLEDDHAEIRLRAAVTCCRLFMRDSIAYHKSSYSAEIINEVLEKLLMVSIADTGSYCNRNIAYVSSTNCRV